jgi:hypothetical protein
MNLTRILILVRQKNGSEKIFRFVTFLCESKFRCRSKRYKDSIEIAIQLDHPCEVMATVILGVSNMKFNNPLPGLINFGKRNALKTAKEFFQDEGQLVGIQAGELIAECPRTTDSGNTYFITHRISEDSEGSLVVESTLNDVVPTKQREAVLEKAEPKDMGSLFFTTDGKLKNQVTINFEEVNENEIDICFCVIGDKFGSAMDAIDAAGGESDDEPNPDSKF